MAWKKVVLKHDIDQIVFVQNTSAIKNSIVRLSFSTEETTPTDQSGIFILSGPNTWTGRVKAGNNLWFEEMGGGIFTYTAYDIEPVVNYRIDPIHVDIVAQSQIIDVPEGAYFVIQNKSKELFRFSIVGEGQFVLTENQMLSFTFTRNTQVRFHGAGQNVSYFYSEAPSLTQLSAELKAKLEEMMAAVNLLKQEAATRAELRELAKKMHYNEYSNEISKEFTVIPSGADFVAELAVAELDADYDSEPLTDNEFIELLFTVKYVSDSETVSSAIYFSGNLDAAKEAFTNNVVYKCYDPLLDHVVEHIKVFWNKDNGTIKPAIVFSDWYKKTTENHNDMSSIFAAPITISYKIRTENAAWKASELAWVDSHVNIFDNTESRFNKRIDFATTKSYAADVASIPAVVRSDLLTVYSNVGRTIITKVDDTEGRHYTAQDADSAIIFKLDLATERHAKFTVELNPTKFTEIADNEVIGSAGIGIPDDSTKSFVLNFDLIEANGAPPVVDKTDNKLKWVINLSVPTTHDSFAFYGILFEKILERSQSRAILHVYTYKK